MKEQEALTRQYDALKQEALAARPFRATVMLQRPTVIAFYPAWAPKLDSAGLRAFLVRSKAVSAGAGWAFEARYSGSLRVSDVRSQTLYTLPLNADSMGFVLAAPVRHPKVRYGRNSTSSLDDQLRRLRAWLPGAASHSTTEL
jgi:hypothetical protein